MVLIIRKSATFAQNPTILKPTFSRTLPSIFLFLTTSLLVMSQNSNDETLVWSDEFNSESLDSSKWFRQTQLPNGWGWYNGEVQHYTDRVDNAFLENGLLKIVAKKESYTDQGQTKAYTSARLNSKKAFQYGRFVIRAKLPTGVGTWPAIWMLGKNVDEPGAYWQTQGFGTTGWPACGEIDIMEHWGSNQNYVQSAMHTPSSYGGTINKGGQTISTASTAFHEYELDWNSERMIFRVDGVVHYTYNPEEKNAATWPFDAEQYLILNVAVEPTIENEFVQSALEIDYIRVYQSEGDGDDDGDGGYFSLHDDFEGNGNITAWSEDAGVLLNTAFDNPFQEGINTSHTVMRYEDTGGTYANIRFHTDENFDLTENSSFSLLIYVPSSSITGSQPNQISLKIQNRNLAQSWTTQCEIIKTVLLDQWQEITFDFSTDPYVNFDPNSPNPLERSDFNQVILQVNSENNSDKVTAYIDDFSYNPALLSVPKIAFQSKVYPNPTKGKIYLEGTVNSASVYTVSGQKILETNAKELDLKELPNGIYLLQVTLQNNSFVTKIVKH